MLSVSMGLKGLVKSTLAPYSVGVGAMSIVLDSIHVESVEKKHWLSL